MEKAQLIVVLGMHRSGTSAITRAFTTMGISLGDRLMPPAAGNNAKGFWEDIDISSLDEKMLHEVGSSWHALLPILDKDVRKLEENDYLERAIGMLHGKVADNSAFGLKDPRIAKLLPFWKKVFSRCEYDVRYVLAIRNPLSVAKSLLARDGMEREKSFFLWLNHVLASLVESEGAKRVVVDYDALLSMPDRELSRMAKALDRTIDDVELTKYKDGFLDSGLRHTAYDPSALDEDVSCPPIVREIYSNLLEVATGKQGIDDAELSAKIALWNSEFRRLIPLLSLVDRLSLRHNLPPRMPAVGKGMPSQQAASGYRRPDSKYAIILHLYYPDLWNEFARLIGDVAGDAALYVSLVGPAIEISDQIKSLFPDARIFAFQNRGRDIAPRIELAERAIADGYDILLFVHGKKSPHLKYTNPDVGDLMSTGCDAGELWRRDLLAKLLAKEDVDRIISRFNDDPAVGFVGAAGHWLPMEHGTGHERTSALCGRLGIDPNGVSSGFFAGSMFWVRAKALSPLLELHLKQTDFEEETGQLDGTLAHAVERVFAMVAEKAGFAVEDSNGARLLGAPRDLPSWLQETVWSPCERQWVESEITRWEWKPKLVVAVAAYKGSLVLPHTLDSLSSQWYPTAAVTVAIDETPVTTINEALLAQDADWFAVIDSGSCLSPDAAFRMAHAVHRQPSLQLLYTDEDGINDAGEYLNPHFKPDFNLDYLRSMPYVGGVLFIRRDLFIALDGFDARFEGVEEYDFLLRAWERLNSSNEAGTAIGHLCGTLHHRRLQSGHSRKPLSDVLASAAVALGEHLGRLNVSSVVERGSLPVSHRVRYRHATKPMVSIIIPTRNQRTLLQRCLESLFAYTAWTNYEILIVDNGSDETDAIQYLDGLRALSGELEGRIRILGYPEPFNYSAMNNMAAREARGDYLLMLNNDTAALHPEWLDAMMEHAQRPEVGVVGAKLLYPDGTVQHAGVILGIKGPAEHPFIGRKATEPGYFARLQVDQDLSAVTGACLLVRRSIFEAVGGLDQAELAVSYSDIDLCLKVRAQGYSVVWTPHAILMHEGSKSQKSGVEETTDPAKAERFLREQAVMYQRWLPQIANDPAYNRYLSLGSTDFAVESDVAVRWSPEWRPVPRIVTQPADRMGCGEYRIIAPTRALINAGRIQGLESQRIYSPAELARIRPDALVLQRQVEKHQIGAIERHKRFTDVFCVFEIDDLVNNVPVKNIHKKLLPKDLYKRLRRAVALCDRLVVTTDALAEAYRDLNADVRVIPNYIEDARWGRLRPARRVGRKPRIGWAGGISHTGDLELISGVVEALKDEVEWVFFGMCPERLQPHIHEFHAPVPLSHYAQQLASLNLDLAVAPLEDVPFNHTKSALRLLEYGILGYPVVCSDLTPYQGDFPVTRVRNRFQDWVEAIRGHLADMDATAAQGGALREHVRTHWLLENNLDTWLHGWLPDDYDWG